MRTESRTPNRQRRGRCASGLSVLRVKLRAFFWTWPVVAGLAASHATADAGAFADCSGGSPRSRSPDDFPTPEPTGFVLGSRCDGRIARLIGRCLGCQRAMIVVRRGSCICTCIPNTRCSTAGTGSTSLWPGSRRSGWTPWRSRTTGTCTPRWSSGTRPAGGGQADPVEAYVAPGDRTDRTHTGVMDGGFHLVLLAENTDGVGEPACICAPRRT